jgi:DNA-binding HxlR family transcriptional regulator
VKSVHFTKYDIALFIDEKGKTRWSHLLKEFVENGSEKHISRQRLSNYLKELVDEGLVTKTVDPRALMFRMYWRVYPIYTVPKSRKKRLQEIRNKKQILEFVDSANPEEIKKLQQHIKDKI